ncbi:hypothetical protein BOX15_Mlig027203g1, partial [Macrostomum lignano]
LQIHALQQKAMYYLRILFSLVFPFFVAKAGLKKKSLSISGALLGYAIGALLAYANACYVAALLAFFASGSYVTRLGAHRKVRLEADFEQGAQRNWIQVLCNGLAAALCAVAYLAFASPPRPELPIDLARYPSPSYVSLALLAALAACCGDTWASEVGAAFAWGQPRLIIGLRRVPPGTNGGVSLVGTAASCAGGGIVGLAYWLAVCAAVPADDLIAAPPQLPLLLAAGAAAGFIGSLVDSLLGATLQYSGFDIDTGLVTEHPGPRIRHISGCRVLNNHLVNLLSSVITCLLLPRLALAATPWLL